LRCLSLAVAVGIMATPAVAYSGFEELVPNGDIHSCNTCHYSDAFGDDFHEAGDQWTVALAALDSDDDGASNGEELGDKYGVWSVDRPNPGDPFKVTNPDDGEDYP
jgi:hypothetical protein